MKPLTLTEEQKNKLLEMCKALFPEWKAHSLITGEQYVSDDTGTFSESDETFKIHWFEFCMTKLQRKMLGVLDYKETESFFMRCLFQSERPHPIDYLYSQFKKLK